MTVDSYYSRLHSVQLTLMDKSGIDFSGGVLGKSYRDFKDLIVWQRSMALVEDVYK